MTSFLTTELMGNARRNTLTRPAHAARVAGRQKHAFMETHTKANLYILSCERVPLKPFFTNKNMMMTVVVL